MTITLLALSLNDSPLTQPITARFDSRGGTIGRADHNTMALPDPERHISRLQAEVRAEGSRYLIKNVGAANPISVGNRQLMEGDSCVLAHDDSLTIGGYRLRVSVDDGRERAGQTDPGRPPTTPGDLSRAPPSPRVARPQSPPPAGFVPPSGPNHVPSPGGTDAAGLPNLESSLSSDNPFADLLGSAPRRPADAGAQAIPGASDPFADLLAPPSGLPVGSKALGSAAPKPASATLPEDFDPFAAPVADRPATARSTSDPFADLRPVGESESIDQMFKLGSRDDAADALARFGASPSPEPGPSGLEAGVSTDPLDLFGGGGKPAVGVQDTPFSNHTPDLHAAFQPPDWIASQKPSALDAAPTPGPATPASAIPGDVTWLRPRTPDRDAQTTRPPAASHLEARAERPPPVDVTPEPVVAAGISRSRSEPPGLPAVSPGRSDADREAALWRAFCSGAGVEIPVRQALDEQLMNTIGQVLQAAVAGTLQLIAVRASTKHELRADVTLIKPRANNPLKFAPDAQTALEQLLATPMRGFMPGPSAMQDAMNDLVGHSIGTMAGMRAALDGVLARFSPEQLESKLSSKSLLDSVMPIGRKARLWDLYRQHFDAIREEAQEDFQTLFGKAFLAAYEQQIERLKTSRESGPAR